MKILITGACGHIGSYLSDNIHKIKKVSKTILVDSLKSNSFNSLFNSQKKNNLNFFNKDIADIKSLDEFDNIDLIIHCASMTNAEKSFGKEKEMFNNNINCMKTVIKYCSENDTKLIHLSSTSVYGKQAKFVDETCEKKFLKPQSPYAKIKIMEENLLKKNINKLRFNTYRLGTISGVSKGIRFHTAVNKFCYQASLNKPVTIWRKFYNKKRPYLNLKDCFKVINYIMYKNLFNGETFDVVTKNYTVKEIIDIISKFTKVKKIFVNTEILNQNSYEVISDSLLRRGFKFSKNISQDVKNTLEILR